MPALRRLLEAGTRACMRPLHICGRTWLSGAPCFGCTCLAGYGLQEPFAQAVAQRLVVLPPGGFAARRLRTSPRPPLFCFVLPAAFGLACVFCLSLSQPGNPAHTPWCFISQGGLVRGVCRGRDQMSCACARAFGAQMRHSHPRPQPNNCGCPLATASVWCCVLRRFTPRVPALFLPSPGSPTRALPIFVWTPNKAWCLFGRGEHILTSVSCVQFACVCLWACRGRQRCARA